MASMFSRPKVQMPAPPPPSPVIEEEKQRKRQAASDAAAMDLATGGRGGDMFAGRDAAMATQMERGKRRVAAKY